MPYPFKLDNEDLKQLILKLTCMSISNIKWSCFYSGCGILHILTDKETKKIFGSPSSIEDNSVKDFFDNLVVLKCMYKKGNPAFSNPPEEILNPGKYMWNFSSFNKLVEPNTQAMAILSLCKTAEIIYNEQKVLGTIMVKDAVVYYDFAMTFMRDDNGFFIAVEDKTKHANEDLKIKQNLKKVHIADQVLMHEALLQLYHTTSNPDIKDYYSSDCSKYLSESRNLFNFIFENDNILLDLSSKEISTCVSSLSRCCKIEHDENQIVSYHQLIALLCAEIETRIKITGEVERNSESLFTASTGTHFRIASALLEGYSESGIEKFRDISFRIYNNLMDLFEPSFGAFSLRGSTKSSYNLRDIADTLKSLLIFYQTTKNEKSFEIITAFYNSCFEKSGIVKCVPERACKILNNEVLINDEIPLVSEIQKAPVFMKNIKIDLKKSPSLSASKHFNSFYALYASYTVLFYLTSLIQAEQPII